MNQRNRQTQQDKKIDSIVFYDGKNIYYKSTAVIKILSKLGRGWLLVRLLLFIPPFIRDLIYDYIAKRRYLWFGVSECRIPSKEEKNKFLP